MQRGDMVRVASIDLGTVSSRLLLAEVKDGVIVDSCKRTIITDLGEGVDATGRFLDAAVARVLKACSSFVEDIEAFAPRAACTTLTSAARDASNGQDLLDGLERLGLVPEVIPGEVEAKLTFYGVAHDFPGERIAVADSGGGSTEVVVGRYTPGEPLEVECARSMDIGCRRVTERFLSCQPARAEDLEAARDFACEQFEPYWSRMARRPERLVAVGGTVTTLVAMDRGMQVYDSSLVHLHDLELSQVEAAQRRLSALSVEQIAALPGIQPKRAPVILAGSLVIGELMRTGGYGSLTVSENSLMAGMAATLYEALCKEVPAIGWMPRVSC